MKHFQKFIRGRDGQKVYHSTFTIRFKGRDYATHTDDPKAAERQLLKRIGESAQDKRKQALGSNGVRVSDLLELVISDYKREAKASIGSMKCYVSNLTPAFGHRRAIDITGDDTDRYKDSRLAEGAKPCTVNHELKALRRGFNLGIRVGKLKEAPVIDFMEERNVRIGFITPQQYQKLLQALPDYLQPLVCVGFHTGMRRGELMEMQRDQVDLEHREIVLQTGTTKNGEGRVVPIYGDMLPVLSAWMNQTGREYPECKWLFHRKGLSVGNFRKTWATATKKAGFDGLLFHDLRRAAVRCMTRSGIPRVIAMSLSGHRTESIYRRYDIVDSSDIRLAGKMLECYMKTEMATA